MKMTMKDLLKALQEQTPTATLIPSSYDTLSFLAPYFEAATTFDSYYLGIKYKDLVYAGEDINDLSTLIAVAIKTNTYKWDKLFKTLSLTYDPIANVDATIEETRDMDTRKRTETMGETSGTISNAQAPFDSSTMKDTAQSTTETDEIENTYEDDAYKDVITTTRKGNIGVTSSQQLIDAERNVADFKYLDVIFYDIMEVISMKYFI